MDLSRQQIVSMLRRTGLNELADMAEATFPDWVDEKTVARFFSAHMVTRSALMDRLGASP